MTCTTKLLGAIVVLLLVTAVGTMSSGAQGVGDLLVTPTRIVFDGNTRSAVVTLVNTGNATALYRISFINMRMTEGGGLEEIKKSDSDEIYAEEFMVYSPRQVSLPPGVPQLVRMQVRKPADLPDGEYRSHMLFRAIPDSGTSNIDNLDTVSEDNFQIMLTPIYGITIPVIVRHGVTSATVSMDDVVVSQASEDQPGLRLDLNLVRTGNRSVYGDIKATFLPDVGQPLVVGRVNGLAVYTPNSLRQVRLNLFPPPGVDLTGGRLHVTYQESDALGGELLAEAMIALP